MLPESYREFCVITHFQFLRASTLSPVKTAVCSLGMKLWKHLGPKHRLFAPFILSIMLNQAAEYFLRGSSVPRTINLSPTLLPHSSQKQFANLSCRREAWWHDD